MVDAIFQPWPKTPRLFRDIVITEKIDGTNAAIQIIEGEPRDPQSGYCAGVSVGDEFFKVAAQSRTRLITPEQDNHGFARWVSENAQGLAETLGRGTHFGEWWGSGIQRGYGLPKGEKRFSLFNTRKWAGADLSAVPGLAVVPIIYTGVFDEEEIRIALDSLRANGSEAAPEFMNPEGVVIYHTAAGQVFKVLIENDELPKGLASEH